MDSRCPREEDLSCSFNLGLCGFLQEEELDNLDWLWHDGSGIDDPYLPSESKQHTHYIYLDTTAPEVLLHFLLLAQSKTYVLCSIVLHLCYYC